MSEILILIILAGLVFVTSLVVLIVGAIKKSKRTMLISIGIFLISLFLGIYGIYQFASKSYHTISNLFEPVTGMEIYESFYGKDVYGCVEILDFQPAEFPIIDYATWMHVKTCPQEFARILSLNPMDTSELYLTEEWEDNSGLVDWFKPNRLGPRVLKFELMDEYGRGDIIYGNTDSTEFYFVNYFR